MTYTYHEVLVDLIYYILNKGDDYLNLLDQGNAYDKLIRNYHQFNAAGKNVYRTKRAKDYLKFSYAAFESNLKPKEMYYEHLIPVNIIKQRLKDSDRSKGSISQIMNSTELIVLTKEEAAYLDQYFRNRLPDNGKGRLEAVGINIHPETANNHL